MHRERTSPSSNRNGSEKSIIALLARQDSAQVQKIWQSERINEYLFAADNRRHTWHAWLAIHGTVTYDAETYRFLTFAKSRQILMDAFGSCPAGMMSALGKFGPFARPKQTYVALHQVLSAGGPLANHACQSGKIDDDDLVSLASVASLPVSNRVMRALLKCKMPAPVLVELMWVISRLTPMHNEQELVRTIVQGRQPGAILANLFSLTPFPQAPFEQIGTLIPITTAEQLRKTGEEFGNCLRDGEELAYALASVQSGQRYFYRWNGDSLALLSFCKCGPAGWILAERSGPRNARVPEAAITRIAEVLTDVPNVFVGKVGAGMLQWICAR
ncbi:hypothetical protein [Mesorhizobium dulcispinae]|uniref:hypothetical protein n=1 Tax=Mesorhizobium dulcispinae TaxID=3072316 RepID=UPI002A243D2A|nr:hypothetical protein [Mesorhizobium sp. VK23D]MDX8521130.1 hypothetical protein [Mesorhizobium sp. VK23D]